MVFYWGKSVGGEKPPAHITPGSEANPLLSSPLLIEPITAWRAWEIYESKNRGVLIRSVTWKMRWPPRKPVRAHCLSQIRGTIRAAPPHSAPDVEHRCGLYAVKNEEQARGWARTSANNRLRIVGKVQLWGRVLVFTEGYLAEYAYPACFLNEDGKAGMFAELMAERYAVALV